MIMRKKGGKEVYDEIKRIRSDVKVLFTSGDTAERMDTDMMLKDRINVITKPISPRNLLNMTRAVLDAPLAV
jgi:DNA-binding response OmpR family regulator